jgi:hypothetical protein
MVILIDPNSLRLVDRASWSVVVAGFAFVGRIPSGMCGGQQHAKIEEIKSV